MKIWLALTLVMGLHLTASALPPSYEIDCGRQLILERMYSYVLDSLRWMLKPESGGYVVVDTSDFVNTAFRETVNTGFHAEHSRGWHQSLNERLKTTGTVVLPRDTELLAFSRMLAQAIRETVGTHLKDRFPALHHYGSARHGIYAHEEGDCWHIDHFSVVTAVTCTYAPSTKYRTMEGAERGIPEGHTLLMASGQWKKALSSELAWTGGIFHSRPAMRPGDSRGVVLNFMSIPN